MPLALDLPPAATGQNSPAVRLNFGEPYHVVPQREEPLPNDFFNTRPARVNVVSDQIDRLLAEGQRKIERLLPLITQRIQEAQEENYLPPLPRQLGPTLSVILHLVAPNPRFATITFDVLRDGGFELVFCSEDRRATDFFSLYWTEEDQAFEVVLNRSRPGQPDFNVFGSLRYVLQQIRENERATVS
jgi:hypothetical protein